MILYTRHRLITSLIEIYSIILCFIWGGMLLLKGNTFESSKSYAYLNNWGEAAWSSISMSIGMIQICGLMLSFFNMGRELRIFGNFFGIVFWSYISYLSFLGNPDSHAWTMYLSLGVILCASLFLYLKTFMEVSKK